MPDHTIPSGVPTDVALADETSTTNNAGGYDPRSFTPLTFCDHRQDFLDGRDSPSDYLERCLATIAEREPAVQAWQTMDVERAREAAAESTARYRAGNPRSSIDGIPIGIKDLYDVRGFPTTEGVAGNDAPSDGRR